MKGVRLSPGSGQKQSKRIKAYKSYMKPGKPVTALYSPSSRLQTEQKSTPQSLIPLQTH